MIRPLTLQLGLSAIREGSELIWHGRAEAGVNLIDHGREFLENNSGLTITSQACADVRAWQTQKRAVKFLDAAE